MAGLRVSLRSIMATYPTCCSPGADGELQFLAVTRITLAACCHAIGADPGIMATPLRPALSVPLAVR